MRYDEAFTNAKKLLEECIKCGLEGIVCKQKDSAYRSGSKSGWIKVKTTTWRELNRDRGELFNPAKRRRLTI